MSEILFHYEKVYPTTWAYLSSLLMIGLFFKFNRVWSVRNFDLILLILLAPGLLLQKFGEARQETAIETAAAHRAAMQQAGQKDAAHGANLRPSSDGTVSRATDGSRTEKLAQGEYARGRAIEKLGFLWLLSIGALLLLRLLLDPTMVRRPLLEPNLSAGGLTFIGCSLFIFLMANIINNIPTEADLQGAKSAEQLLAGRAGEPSGEGTRQGPGNAVLHLLPSIPTMPLMRSQEADNKQFGYMAVSKTMAILSHLAVVIGIVAIGYQHFDNIRMGIGAATLYLMLPYTAQMTGRVPHVLPAALLVWAILTYRRPSIAGFFIGMAIGVIYYPLFLLPLWLSFYWQRGLMRFTFGVMAALVVNAFSQIFISADLADYLHNLKLMFGLWPPKMEGLDGIWGLGWDPVYRVPVLAAFVALSGTLALWPAQKNLGTLLSCSAAVMVATQFWHGHGGGLYMAWFLPLLLLTIFRPNLEDRVALSVLGNGWLQRRRSPAAAIERAA